MHPLYKTALEVVKELEEAQYEVARLSMELERAEYALRLRQAQVEEQLIDDVGGEKNLAPTVADRKRVFILALEDDVDYRTRLERQRELSLALEKAKIKAGVLRYRINVILAAMRADSQGGDNQL